MWVLKFVHFMQPNKWDDIKNYQRVGCFHYLNSNLFLFFYLRIVFWEIHESSKMWSMLLLKTPQKYKAHKVSHWAYSRFFRSLRISLGSVTAVWSHLLKKSLIQNFIFCTVKVSHFHRGYPKFWSNLSMKIFVLRGGSNLILRGSYSEVFLSALSKLFKRSKIL